MFFLFVFKLSYKKSDFKLTKQYLTNTIVICFIKKKFKEKLVLAAFNEKHVVLIIMINKSNFLYQKCFSGGTTNYLKRTFL